MEIHDQILRKIANTLFGNVQQMDLLGLFNGQLGPALFFYHYSRYINKSIYAEIASDCIDAIYGEMGVNMPKDFANGMTGVGWAINHLIEHEFIETEDDNILEEVDEAVKKMDMMDFINDISEETPLFSKGLYAIARREPVFIAMALVECKDFLGKNEIVFPLCYLNSVLYMVIRAYQSGIESSLCEQLMSAVYQHVTIALEKKRNAESDWVTLQHLVRHIGQDISTAANWQLLLNVIEISQKAFLKSCWNGFIYGESGLKHVPMSDIQTFVDDIVRDLHYKDLALYSGLSGLGIELIKLNQTRE